MIFDAYQVSIDVTIQSAEQLSDDAAAVAEDAADEQSIFGSIVSRLIFIWIIKLVTGIDLTPSPIPRRHV